jgi:hypothetical protein
MKRDNAESPTGREQRRRLREGLRQCLHFVIHRDPDRLEGPRRDVQPPRPRGPRHRPLHDADEVRRPRERRALPPIVDAAGDTARVALLPVLEDDPRELLDGEPVQQVGGGRARCGSKRMSSSSSF